MRKKNSAHHGGQTEEFIPFDTHSGEITIEKTADTVDEVQLMGESLARRRHEYSTQIKYIVEFSKLLIDEARERHLDRFIPDFRKIHEGGRGLLALIDNLSDQHLGTGIDSEERAFGLEIRAVALEISRTLTSLAEYPECAHRPTLVDFEAISGALDHLLKVTGSQPAYDDGGERTRSLYSILLLQRPTGKRQVPIAVLAADALEDKFYCRFRGDLAGVLADDHAEGAVLDVIDGIEALLVESVGIGGALKLFRLLDDTLPSHVVMSTPRFD